MKGREFRRTIDYHLITQLPRRFAIVVEVLRAAAVLINPVDEDQSHEHLSWCGASTLDDLDQLLQSHDLTVRRGQMAADAAHERRVAPPSALQVDAPLDAHCAQ